MGQGLSVFSVCVKCILKYPVKYIFMVKPVFYSGVFQMLALVLLVVTRVNKKLAPFILYVVWQ